MVSDTITNVSDRDTLLAAILNDPADDTARLVLADVLRESDNPDAHTRAVPVGRRHRLAVP